MFVQAITMAGHMIISATFRLLEVSLHDKFAEPLSHESHSAAQEEATP